MTSILGLGLILIFGLVLKLNTEYIHQSKPFPVDLRLNVLYCSVPTFFLLVVVITAFALVNPYYTLFGTKNCKKTSLNQIHFCHFFFHSTRKSHTVLFYCRISKVGGCVFKVFRLTSAVVKANKLSGH